MLLPPINFLFKLMQTKTPIKIWLFENTGVRMEGSIVVSICGMCLKFVLSSNTLSRDLTNS